MAETIQHPYRGFAQAGAVLRLLRIKDWVKNLVILLPLFFSGRMGEAALLGRGLVAVAVFCLISSAVYIFNDLRDREMDRLHPVKRLRPIASGAVPAAWAAVLFAVLLAVGIAVAILFIPAMLPLAVAYILLNFAYSLKLKFVPVIDICIIASGYVIRILTGGVVTQTALSVWIITMTFLLAMFIGLAKRRDDVVICLESGVEVRRIVEAYNLKFIDAALSIMAAVTIMAYLMYTISPGTAAKFGTDRLYLTTSFVVAGILRYLQMILVEKKGGFPTEILYTDILMQLLIGGWLLSFGLLIYVAR